MELKNHPANRSRRKIIGINLKFAFLQLYFFKDTQNHFLSKKIVNFSYILCNLKIE